ncbi:MAG: hypothetical protein GWN71_26395, partial [Gammaproteobacteria bacterium]|nr:hypothetical protein [Gemmatimonadota bacterium]NIU76957.1 hypothetical protein [Gammaproteobacteria bacterium]
KPQMTSHETACILNASDRDARVEITVYFTDREPAGPYRLTVPARRTRHLRFNQLNDPEPIPEPPGWHADSRFTRRRGAAGAVEACATRTRRA